MRLALLLSLVSLAMTQKLRTQKQISMEVPYLVSYYSGADDDGSFRYGYETSDDTKVSAEGEQRAVGPERELGTVMRGSYSYVAPNGLTYTVSWVADEQGFQPRGDHLP